MANDYLQRSDLTNVLTSEFDRRVPIYLNKFHWLYDFFNTGKLTGQSTRHKGEDYYKIPIQTSVVESVYPSIEMQDTPDALNPTWNQGQLALKKIVGSVAFSEESLVLSNGPNTFIDTWKRNTQGLIMALRKDLSCYLQGTGDGSLGVVASADDGADTITLDSARHIRKGMVLDVYDNDASPNEEAADLVVDYVDYPNNVVYFSGSPNLSGVAADSKLFKAGSHPTTQNPDRAPMGLGVIVDDDTGSYLGLSRDTYKYMKAIVADGDSPGTPQALTWDRILDLDLAMRQGSYGETADMVYTSAKVERKFYQLMRDEGQPIERMPRKDGMPGGLKLVLSGKELPVYGDVHGVPNTMFFLNKSNMLKYTGGETGWATRGSGSPFHKIADKLAYECIYRFWVNFAGVWPEANGRLNDITE